ncbi:MAG: hypothetical protein HY696_06460 [Deltaproteobacteria bacterium]|nr:hypothetical protein [Deltaproteobacteria bacterium]
MQTRMPQAHPLLSRLPTRQKLYMRSIPDFPLGREEVPDLPQARFAQPLDGLARFCFPPLGARRVGNVCLIGPEHYLGLEDLFDANYAATANAFSLARWHCMRPPRDVPWAETTPHASRQTKLCGSMALHCWGDPREFLAHAQAQVGQCRLLFLVDIDDLGLHGAQYGQLLAAAAAYLAVGDDLRCVFQDPENARDAVLGIQRDLSKRGFAVMSKLVDAVVVRESETWSGILVAAKKRQAIPPELGVRQPAPSPRLPAIVEWTVPPPIRPARGPFEDPFADLPFTRALDRYLPPREGPIEEEEE